MDDEAQVLGDVEIGALRRVVIALDALPDDDAKRRVIVYAQARCIKPAAPSDYALAQQGFIGQLRGGGLK